MATTHDERREAFLRAKRMLRERPKRGGLFDEPDPADLVRRSMLVRLVQRVEPDARVAFEPEDTE